MHITHRANPPRPKHLLCLTLALSATLAAAVALAPATAEAKAGPFGLGIIGGNPTGLTGKYFFNREGALDFHLGIGGWGAGRHRDFGIYVDYLHHFDLGVRNSVLHSMAIYVGGGGEIIFDDDGYYCGNWRKRGDCRDRDNDRIWIAARAPIGLNLMFGKVPLELFIEIVPTLYIIQYITFDIDLALGLRFYF
jgi:hypothetical protein